MHQCGAAMAPGARISADQRDMASIPSCSPLKIMPSQGRPFAIWQRFIIENLNWNTLGPIIAAHPLDCLNTSPKKSASHHGIKPWTKTKHSRRKAMKFAPARTHEHFQPRERPGEAIFSKNLKFSKFHKNQNCNHKKWRIQCAASEFQHLRIWRNDLTYKKIRKWNIDANIVPKMSVLDIETEIAEYNQLNHQILHQK